MSEKLAIHGGTPTRKELLPFSRPSFGQEEIDEVADTLRSGWITTGPKTKRFEEDFRAYIGCRCALGVNSCTAALHLALAAKDIGPGDEVITTPITFPATANVIVHQGATPVFADVEPDTFNLDPAAVEKKITPRTKAIIPVHFLGHPAEMDAFSDLAKRHNLLLVEDAAHAIEAAYKGRKVGTLGDVAAFSFYATKNLTTGEGGMLTTNDESYMERLRVLSLHGISKDAWKRYQTPGYQHWESIEAGYKYNMFDIQASLGIHQLRKVEGWRERRRQLSENYLRAFADLEEVRPVGIRPHVRHAYHLFALWFDRTKLSVGRDEIMSALEKENIGIGIHFRCLTLMKFFREKYGYKPGDFPVAEKFGDGVISLPLYAALTDDQQKDVIAAVRKVVKAFQRI